MALEDKLIEIAENEQKVFEAGKDAFYDFFWDEFQQEGKLTNYICAFGGQWTPETFKPKYPIKPQRAYMLFYNNYGQVLRVDDFVEFCKENNIVLDFSDCIDAQYALACLWGTHFGTLDFSKCTGTSSLGYLFYSHTNATNGVKKIDNFISSANTTFNATTSSAGTFNNATYLTDITMSGVVAKDINFGTCPLNKASITSVINALSASVSGKTVTFKKTAINSAFGINIDNESTYTTEWNSLRGSKSNWSFSFV